MSVQCEAEQLPDPLSNRIAVLERQVQQLIEQSVEKIYFKAAVAEVDAALAEVDGRLAVVEIAPEVDSRFKAMETSLRELGAHFVRYQKDFVSNLEKKFEVFEQQMHIHEDRIKVFTQEAKARTREQMTEELVSTSASIQPVGTNGNTKSNWDNWKDTSTRESWSTVASEESEKQGELEHLMCGAREDIDMIHKDLRAHIASTEKRLAALEIGHISHHKKIQAITNAAAEDVTFEANGKPPQWAKSPAGGVKQLSWNDFDTVLQGLMSSVSQCCQSASLRQPPEEQPTPVHGSTPMPNPSETSHHRMLSPSPSGSLDASLSSTGMEKIRKILDPASNAIGCLASNTIAAPSMGHQTPSGTATPTVPQGIRWGSPKLFRKPEGALEPSSSTESLEAQRAVTLKSKWPQNSPAQKAPSRVPLVPAELARTARTRRFDNAALSLMGDKFGSSRRIVSCQARVSHSALELRVRSTPGKASPSQDKQVQSSRRER
mmetsp:Transcript_47139/g.85076  ORF Transcript_47139/g.85076 Transcript_47139/m.85076 type:complete len:490 (-) Transcript_47139:128-1597(-)